MAGRNPSHRGGIEEKNSDSPSSNLNAFINLATRNQLRQQQQQQHQQAQDVQRQQEAIHLQTLLQANALQPQVLPLYDHLISPNASNQEALTRINTYEQALPEHHLSAANFAAPTVNAAPRNQRLEDYASLLMQSNNYGIAPQLPVLPQQQQLLNYQAIQGFLQNTSTMPPANNEPAFLAANGIATTPNGTDLVRFLPLIRAALDQIPFNEKTQYLQAMNVAQQLVNTESDPLKFLRHQGYNARVTAHRLVTYWRRRCEIFGDRAFLPLTSALDKDAVQFLQFGEQVILPSDSEGCPVLCFDTSRRLEDSPGIRSKAAFFIGQKISENPMAHTKGCVVLFIVSDPKHDSVTSQCHAMMMNNFPIKIKAWHFIDCIPNWKKTTLSFNSYVASAIQAFAPVDFPTFIHSTKNEKFLDNLEVQGLQRGGLPSFLGGRWGFDQMIKWIDEQFPNITGISPSSSRRCVTASSTEDDTNSDSKPAAVSNSPVTASHNTEQVFRSQFARALQLLPPSETAAYRNALQEASASIWQEESDPMAFLRAEAFHPRFAAQRIARYWNLRVSAFQARCHMPLYQNCEDALDRGDLSTLSTCFGFVLPNDDSGSSVLWINPDRLSKSSPASRNRCLFYLYSLLAENERSQTYGAVLLYQPSAQPIEFMEQLADAIPLRFKAVHLFGEHQRSEEHMSLGGGPRTYMHPPNSTHILKREFGLSVLPQELGGQWGHTKVLHWGEIRTRMEWRIPMGLGGRDMDDALKFPCIRAYELLPDETERKRRLNVEELEKR